MATTSVKVNVVDVGQGQCTFVEVYGDDSKGGAPLETLLFDCGSDSHSDKVRVNLTYIATVLYQMKSPSIDCLVFSHSDSDHISLMQTLLDIYKKATDKVLVIKNVWFGGNYDQYEKNRKNVLKFLIDEKYCGDDDDISGIFANYTGIDPTTGNVAEHLWESADGDVQLFPIVGNVLTAKPDFSKPADKDVPERKSAEAKNRVSIVCGLSFASVSYVICGDATNITMAAINLLFNTASTTIFANNQMTTIPHHGSRTTGMRADSKSDNVKKNAKAIVQRFVTILQSQTFTVSSFQQHEHPSLQFLSLFPPAKTSTILQDIRLALANNHMMVAYKDMKISSADMLVNNYYTAATTSNLFGTDYYAGAKPAFNLSFDAQSVAVYSPPTDIKPNIGSINSGACWIYTTAADGSTILKGVTHLSYDDADTFTQPATVAGPFLGYKFQTTTPAPRPAAKSTATPQRKFATQLSIFR